MNSAVFLSSLLVSMVTLVSAFPRPDLPQSHPSQQPTFNPPSVPAGSGWTQPAPPATLPHYRPAYVPQPPMLTKQQYYQQRQRQQMQQMLMLQMLNQNGDSSSNSLLTQLMMSGQLNHMDPFMVQ